MGAAYLCGLTDIDQHTLDNNAAYIKSWIRTFKDDPKILVLAAAQAQKAVDYMLAHQSVPADTQEEFITEEAPMESLPFLIPNI